MEPSTGQENSSFSVRVLLNMAGVDANLPWGIRGRGGGGGGQRKAH